MSSLLPGAVGSVLFQSVVLTPLSQRQHLLSAVQPREWREGGACAHRSLCHPAWQPGTETSVPCGTCVQLCDPWTPLERGRLGGAAPGLARMVHGGRQLARLSCRGTGQGPAPFLPSLQDTLAAGVTLSLRPSLSLAGPPWARPCHRSSCVWVRTCSEDREVPSASHAPEPCLSVS